MATELPQTRAGGSDRDSFLDALRAIAILRVIVWHTYGVAWISYFVASLPVMFFVAGSLMALSLQRGQALNVLYRRFRRLLPPLWVMGVFAIGVMVAYDRANDGFTATVPLRHVVWWVFPIWDPTGSDWGITWWAPLWYLRCLTWLMLASPLLLFLWRRTGPLLLLAPVAALAVLEVQISDGKAVPWQLQDAALYAFFWLLGFAYNDGRLKSLPRPANLLLSPVCACAAAAWALTQDVPANIVNASYPLHLLVALTWLFGFLALRGPIGRLALRPRVDGLIYWVNERALTIYLWHAAGLFCMYQLLWSRPHSALARNLEALPIVVSVTFLAVLLMGWIEDVAAGRSPRLWPTRRTADGRPARRGLVTFGLPVGALTVAGVFALVAGAAGVVDQPSTLVQPTSDTVPASGVGLRLRTERAQITKSRPVRETPKTEESKDSSSTGEAAESAPPLPPATGADLEAILAEWEDKWDFGLTVSLQRESGEHWTGSVGAYDDGSEFRNNEVYWIGSVTKTFTAAIVLRLAEQGALSLDDPVSKFVPEFPGSDRFTVRQLIQHTSGLIVGDETPYNAIAEAAHQGLLFEPGTAFEYSRAGYYLLGLVIEQVTGKAYTTVVHEELIDPLGLSSTLMDEEIWPLWQSSHPFAQILDGLPGVTWTSGGLYRGITGEINYHGIHWSSGGLYSTTSDLARWALALWGSDRVVSETTLDEMTNFLGPGFNFTGLGTFATCPCWEDANRLMAERWGHLGATGSIEYDPVDKVALAMHISGSVTDENVIEALDELSATLRAAVRDRALEVENVDSSAQAQADAVERRDPQGPRSCDEIAGRTYASEIERRFFLSSCSVPEPALGAPESAEAEDVSSAASRETSSTPEIGADDGLCTSCETPSPAATPESACASTSQVASACTCGGAGALTRAAGTASLCPHVLPSDDLDSSTNVSLDGSADMDEGGEEDAPADTTSSTP